jgi:hypothetical protein
MINADAINGELKQSLRRASQAGGPQSILVEYRQFAFGAVDYS